MGVGTDNRTRAITGRGMTLGDVVARHARITPDAVAYVFGDVRRTYGELDERVTRLADALAGSGVRAGERVAVLGLNSLEVVESFLACNRLGAICVPVNFRLVAAEIGYVLADSGAVAVVVDAVLADRVQAARPPGLHTVVTIGGDYEQLLADASPEPAEIAVPDDLPGYIMYTSGTTGRPKGAVLTHRNLLLHAFSSIAHLGTTAEDRVWFAAAPLFHIAGLAGLYPTMLCGGRIVVSRSGAFDAAETVATLERERVTSAFFVPAQWQAILALPDLAGRDLAGLRRISWGAAPATSELLTAMIAAFPQAEVITSFGQTECSPVTCTLRGVDALRKLGSVGTPMLNVEVRVVDDDMNDVPRGDVGEIVYRGPLVMSEYWNKPAETAEAFEGGWFHSGDLVRQDEDGYYWVVDRKKDMIISGGENIYSAEVENALTAHPGVADVAVIGMPDPTWGETPLAVVVAADPAAPPTLASVEEHCRATLASYKRPRRLEVVDVLPRNPSGKVLKTELRARYR